MPERKQRDGKELWLIATEAMAEHMKVRKAEQPKHDWDDIAHWIAEAQVVGVQAVYDLAVEETGKEGFYKKAAIQTESEITDILANALGYPEYQPGDPGYSPDRVNYVIGDHVATSLAMEAAGRLEKIEQAASLLDVYTHDLDTFGTITMNVLRRAIALLTE